MSIAIKAERLGKSYWINAPQPDASTRRVEKVALSDVSFEVEEGEVLGVIGRNGSGKSTLLKILSRITAPTRGRARVSGTTAALLEVGTGMHPEMTGRENIFLNGTLLGMTKKDITRQLEAIVNFAGVAEYIDTPIKHYSSGMKLRLAFAVAAFLAADIMIVDEVLAVGDAEFQAKCTGAMQEATGRGRTTLFVSHNMAVVEKLCSRVLWIEQGEIRAAGATAEIVRQYLSSVETSSDNVREFTKSDHTRNGVPMRFVRASAVGANGGTPIQGDDMLLHLELELYKPIRGLQILVSISTLEGQPVCMVSNGDYCADWNLQPGPYTVTIRLKSIRLLPRTHVISLQSFINWGAEVFDNRPDALTFAVLGRDVLGTGISILANRGVTWMPAEFNISKNGSHKAIATQKY